MSALVPPADLDAERVVLSSLMLRPERLREIDGLRPEDAFSREHQVILGAILRVAESGSEPELAAVHAWLRDHGELDAAGGTRYLADLIDGPIPYAHDLAAQAERVRSRAELRRLQQACSVVVAEAYDSGADPTALRARLATLGAGGAEPIGAKGGPRLAWRDGTMLATELAKRRWAVRGLQIGPGRPTLVVAYAGTAKTLACQSLCLAYAAGIDAWGRWATGGGGVARHLDYEQGGYATQRRYQRLAWGLDLDLRGVGARLQTVSFPALYLGGSSESAWEREIDGAGLVVIDSLRAAAPGLDENDSRVRACVDTLTRISERTACAVVLIHHAGKDKQGHAGDSRQVARGSSALMDAAGCSYLLEMSELSEPRRIRQTKLPAESDGACGPDGWLSIEDIDGPTGPTHGLRITYQDKRDEAAREIRRRDPERTLQAARERVLEVLANTADGASLRRLRALVQGKHAVLEAAVEAEVESGRVEVGRATGRTGGGGRSYRLTGSGWAAVRTGGEA